MRCRTGNQTCFPRRPRTTFNWDVQRRYHYSILYTRKWKLRRVEQSSICLRGSRSQKRNSKPGCSHLQVWLVMTAPSCEMHMRDAYKSSPTLALTLYADQRAREWPICTLLFFMVAQYRQLDKYYPRFLEGKSNLRWQEIKFCPNSQNC